MNKELSITRLRKILPSVKVTRPREEGLFVYQLLSAVGAGNSLGGKPYFPSKIKQVHSPPTRRFYATYRYVGRCFVSVFLFLSATYRYVA